MSYGALFASMADLVTGASADAAFVQAYNRTSQLFAQRQQALNAKDAAQQNIAAIEQDRVTSSMQVQMQQDQQEAQVKVAAALAGTEGGSVEMLQRQTEINKAFALSQVNRNADQQIEQYAAEIYASDYALRNTQTSIQSNAASTPSSLEAIVGGALSGVGQVLPILPDIANALQFEELFGEKGGIFLPDSEAK